MSAPEFQYREDTLVCENVRLDSVATQFGTPAYLYSRRAIVNRYHQYEDALNGIPHRVCFAVKSNSNLAVLSVLAQEGAGFDIVSGGELFRVLSAGGNAANVVFSGVGKTGSEMRYALECGIHSFNCESEFEINQLSRIASETGRSASIALRVNPDVDAVTHPYISTGLREHKFGVDIREAEEVYGRVQHFPGIRPEGVSCHIGSQLLDVNPLLDAADKVLALVDRLDQRGIGIKYVDLGGGLGVPYRSGERPTPTSTLIAGLKSRLANRNLTVMLEPGRSVVAEAGVLLTRVLGVKHNGKKTFVIVDAAMNDLIRPALYQAHHEIVPVHKNVTAEQIVADIVGPVCETGDFFGRGRQLPALETGDLLAIHNAGAYGFVLSSNYNSRPRVCELLVDGSHVHLARARETFDDLICGEHPYQTKRIFKGTE